MGGCWLNSIRISAKLIVVVKKMFRYSNVFFYNRTFFYAAPPYFGTLLWKAV